MVGVEQWAGDQAPCPGLSGSRSARSAGGPGCTANRSAGPGGRDAADVSMSPAVSKLDPFMEWDLRAAARRPAHPVVAVAGDGD